MPVISGYSVVRQRGRLYVVRIVGEAGDLRDVAVRVPTASASQPFALLSLDRLKAAGGRMDANIDLTGDEMAWLRHAEASLRTAALDVGRDYFAGHDCQDHSHYTYAAYTEIAGAWCAVCCAQIALPTLPEARRLLAGKRSAFRRSDDAVAVGHIGPTRQAAALVDAAARLRCDHELRRTLFRGTDPQCCLPKGHAGVHRYLCAQLGCPGLSLAEHPHTADCNHTEDRP